MADDTNKQPDQPAAPTGGADVATDRISRALAEAGKLAEEQSIDEGEEGGHYIVNGQHVDAEGRPIKKYSK